MWAKISAQRLTIEWALPDEIARVFGGAVQTPKRAPASNSDGEPPHSTSG